MRFNVAKSRARNARNELAMLLLASMAVVAALTYAVTRGTGALDVALGLEKSLLIVLVTAAALMASALVWRAIVVARDFSRSSRLENSELRSSLATAEAVMKAEPQILLLWDQEQEPRIVAQTLTNVVGLPQRKDDILRFAQWLEPRSASLLKTSLDELFQQGRSFNIIVRTAAADHIEAEGRAAGGRAVLRLRDVAGYKRDLARIIDQHQWLARDIRSMRALLNALPMPVWLKTRDGRLSWVNQAYVRAVESPSDDEVLSRQIELMDSRERNRAMGAIAKGQEFRSRLQLVIGSERKAHDVIMLPTEDTIAGAAIDVAAIKTAEDELQRQIQAYDRTLDHVATAVAIFDREFRLAFYNVAFRSLWSLEDEWLASRPLAGSLIDRLHERGLLPDMPNYLKWKSTFLAIHSTGEPFRDLWLLPGDRIVEVMAELRPDGGVTYLFSDETKRLVLESDYNALISVQRETLDSLKEGVAVFATDGHVKLHNSAFATIWNLSRDQLGKKPYIDEVIGAACAIDDEQKAWLRIRQVVTSFLDTRPQIAGQIIRAEGSVIDFATTPLPDGGTLVTFVDVTVSKRYERALLERNEALVLADKLRNQFISHISYELRTPLTTIIGFSDLLASRAFGPLNTRQSEYVDGISQSSKSLLAIIDDILDLATIDAGSLKLELGPVDVADVIDDAILGVRDRAARAALTIDIGIEESVTTFNADERRVRQVLYNLISNAVGFSREGGTIRITCWREGASTVFEVEDEGVGIPAEQQKRVFDRFVSRSHGSKHRGTGLGLSLAKSLVELHGGTLELYSEAGKGTRVTVRFPEIDSAEGRDDDDVGDEPGRAIAGRRTTA
ncbi:MAG: PAS-domain containing protein [Hyphomicrobiaceae bacterium]|nr:PAS-domain containing protein [Hyphomicrobiaceae bacterium]